MLGAVCDNMAVEWAALSRYPPLGLLVSIQCVGGYGNYSIDFAGIRHCTER